MLFLIAAVALLESVAPEEMLAAERPPRLDTTVVDCVPVTSPVRLPVKLVALPAVVAVAALPFRTPVMMPAEKFPLASRVTSVLAVFAEAAVLARVAPAAMFAALRPPTVDTTVAGCVPMTSPARLPVKLEALPLTLPVTFPVRLPLKVPVVVPPRVRPEASCPLPTAPVASLAVVTEPASI